MVNVNHIVGTHDLVFITLDTLRFDVAEKALQEGRTPNFKSVLPGQKWERRHSPATFTYAAHHAFFAGFLPTPESSGTHPRLLASAFPGSETTTSDTFTYQAPTWIEALRELGYYTICIGGVGFFSKLTALGSVFPNLFDCSYWSPELSVTSAVSTERQVELACRLLREAPSEQRLLVFINISALHQPNCIFSPGEVSDTPATQATALSYVDGCLPPLLRAVRSRAPSFWIVCSDHGTAYGEGGYVGHRLAHPVVWTVPYAHFVLPQDSRVL